MPQATYQLIALARTERARPLGRAPAIALAVVEDADDAARAVLQEVVDDPILACAWVTVIADLPATATGLLDVIVYVLRREPIRSPFVLVITPAEALAADIRWPGPSVRFLRRWERARVVVRPGVHEGFLLTVPDLRKPLHVRTQNGGDEAGRLRELLRSMAE